jgi:hypothetical protein
MPTRRIVERLAARYEELVLPHL